ncbi:GfV-B15-ORF2 [Ichnoviriform fumiferanae]|uniref:GfV-B15-ORF2 n=1 Tax=Ichnoviriform fumiferanae TaxID=419435 RepID=A2PZR4_9VIRU|nr:GfV-B15-ORF2 [Ichnoviriform fumiferanae]BAF45486.1 GfV-B15-ORF2 [Ichnoviriform fumiferanae]
MKLHVFIAINELDVKFWIRNTPKLSLKCTETRNWLWTNHKLANNRQEITIPMSLRLLDKSRDQNVFLVLSPTIESPRLGLSISLRLRLRLTLMVNSFPNQLVNFGQCVY